MTGLNQGFGKACSHHKKLKMLFLPTITDLKSSQHRQLLCVWD